MDRAIVVRGRLGDPKRIDLEEPVTEIQGEVEVIVRSVSRAAPKESIFDLIARLPGGPRSKQEIDLQIHEERESWGNR